MVFSTMALLPGIHTVGDLHGISPIDGSEWNSRHTPILKNLGEGERLFHVQSRWTPHHFGLGVDFYRFRTILTAQKRTGFIGTFIVYYV